jgi:hypothetical protein
MNKRDWKPATLASVVAAGDPIIVWCNNRACAYWHEHGQQYRVDLTVTDLAAYAEKLGGSVTFADFRKRLRCRHCGCRDVSTVVDRPYVTPGERQGGHAL